MKKIGWIGTGIMGHAMVSHIIKAWYEVYVYNRTKEKTDALIWMWAKYTSSIWEVTQKSDIIFTIIWNPQSVEDAYFWANGITENLDKWKTVVDMTTTKPSLSVKIDLASKKKWAYSLDAPVSGGDVGAINGTLSIYGMMRIVDFWWNTTIFWAYVKKYCTLLRGMKRTAY